MGIIAKVRRQTAVWWHRTGLTREGQAILSGPVEINCRWQDTAEEVTSADGRSIISKSMIMTDREIPVGDFLWLGELKTAPSEPPLTNDVKVSAKIPNFKNTETLFKVYL